MGFRSLENKAAAPGDGLSFTKPSFSTDTLNWVLHPLLINSKRLASRVAPSTDLQKQSALLISRVLTKWNKTSGLSWVVVTSKCCCNETGTIEQIQKLGYSILSLWMMMTKWQTLRLGGKLYPLKLSATAFEGVWTLMNVGSRNDRCASLVGSRRNVAENNSMRN